VSAAGEARTETGVADTGIHGDSVIAITVRAVLRTDDSWPEAHVNWVCGREALLRAHNSK
jgi:hypothetical protein